MDNNFGRYKKDFPCTKKQVLQAASQRKNVPLAHKPLTTPANMAKDRQNKNNDWKERLNIVYSTNPDFKYQVEQEEEQQATLPATQQRLRVQLDRRNRGGKTVTLITGFVGTEDDLKDLGKWLKTKCGTGGSAKEGEIIIQGDWKEKVAELLKTKGYTQTKVSG